MSMAKGTASEEYVVLSNVRSGFKRELAFALKAQAEISGTIGPTRLRRTQARVPMSPVPLTSQNKRLKKTVDDSEQAKVIEEEEARAAGHKLADLISEEETTSNSVDSSEDENLKSDIVPGEVEDSSVEGVGFTACEVVTRSTEDCKDSSKKKKESVKNAISKDGVFIKKGNSLMSQKSTRRVTRSQLKPKAAVMEADDMDKIMSASLRTSDLESIAALPGSMSTKLEKKIGLRRPFLALKEFLDSGLLEGLHVKYARGVRSSHQARISLEGIISGNGILCSCTKCKGLQVVSPTVFELHAGSSNKHPPENIMLDNGRRLRDVMCAVRDSTLETLEEAVQAVLDPLSLRKCTLCLNCKGSIGESCDARLVLLCHLCLEKKESHVSATEVTDAGSPDPCLTMKSPSRTLNVSSSDKKSQGRVTRKDLRLHKLVFEDDILPDGTEVAYFSRGKKLLVGYKSGHGIFCTCCNIVISASSFEAHAGFEARRKPYLNIYTSNGVSLHELALSLLKTRRVSINNNDDLCSICYGGEDLLCCDTCPRAFHLECVPLPRLPVGGWNCRYCQNMFQKEISGERRANALAAGRVVGADAIEEITKRCIRIIKTVDTEVGGCALCRSQSFTTSGFGPRTVIICDQCEKEYHVGCLRDHKMANLKELPEGNWFCCVDCDHIHSVLEKMVSQGEQELPDSLVDITRKKLEEKDPTCTPSLDIRWRVLNVKMDSSDESRRLLSKAVAIFHERFDPIVDNGRDLIPTMVYGRNHKGQDFSGMFNVILLVNKQVVSAGLLRIFGVDAAELPLVATSTDFQGQGYFQSLFLCMERLLASFRVKKLVLPAAEEAKSIWTKKFLFAKPTPEELMELRGKQHMMIFDGTSVLQKLVPTTIDPNEGRELEFCAERDNNQSSGLVF